ncbi:putative tegumental protein [Fasciola hepatica]|uniref:Tegumental protein n=1 Tax=Fasciola hepatica TaxID=6192 RepID=A0A4E0R6U0_FASHE|nr:putative tegumental protein [Fasciola hepatica]
MSQDTFLSAFENIDRDHDGVIHIRDLEEYAKNDGVSPDFVQKWKLLFDPNNTGQITFENFCSTLGVSKKVRDSAERRRRPEPKVYESNMSLESVDHCLQVIKRNYNHNDPDSSIHVTLTEMDGSLGPRWQARAVKLSENPKPAGEYLTYSLDNGEHKYVLYREPEKRRNKCCCC